MGRILLNKEAMSTPVDKRGQEPDVWPDGTTQAYKPNSLLLLSKP